ncbi:hypothetical protein [Streptomyces sp. GZWMJZ-114]|uniref:hypothetical protein n=1 Tax=Streptomyces sp. GZWMJZ-114 TaxID=2494734 RepID=UPI001F505901|nr:hypothetical protein [Streptomyces sp. GZWMJZ-114]
MTDPRQGASGEPEDARGAGGGGFGPPPEGFGPAHGTSPGPARGAPQSPPRVPSQSPSQGIPPTPQPAPPGAPHGGFGPAYDPADPGSPTPPGIPAQSVAPSSFPPPPLYPPGPPTALAPPPGPPAAPRGPRDVPRALGLALLDLSGLGIGHALLRSWGGFAVALVSTGALALVALPADPDGVPLALVVGWLVILVLLAAHAAARGLRTTRPVPTVPVLGLALVLLAAPVLAGFEYDAARERAQHARLEKQLLDRLGEADRTVARYKTSGYAGHESAFSSALTAYRDLSRDHPGSAAAHKVPARLRTYYRTVGAPFGKGDYCEAVDPLRHLLTVPRTMGTGRVPEDLAAWPAPRLATSLYGCGIGGLGTKDSSTAEYHLTALLEEYPDSPEAGKVVPEVEKHVSFSLKDKGGESPCDATSSLQTLADQATSVAKADGAPAATVTALGRQADRAKGGLPTKTWNCALDAYHDKDYAATQSRMRDFTARYGKDGRAPLARKYVIAAQVADELPAAGKVKPTTSSGGSITVTVRNDSPEAVEVLYTGPVTGSFQLGGCESCKRYEWADTLNPAFKPCPSGRTYPSKTLRLPAGTTYFLHKPRSGSGLGGSPATDTVKVRGGYTYTECAYTAKGFGSSGIDG